MIEREQRREKNRDYVYAKQSKGVREIASKNERESLQTL